MMTDNAPWKETFVLFPKRDALTGTNIWGYVMVRHVSGTKQYRALTHDEECQAWLDLQ